MVEISNTITSYPDKCKDVKFIFSEISKTFDRSGIRVSFKRQDRISDQVTNKMENNLLNRKQKVVLDGYSSILRSIGAGVP